MSKAWITDRWLKKSATPAAKRSLNSSKDPLKAKSVPEEFKTSVFGTGSRWRVDWYEEKSGKRHSRTKTFIKLSEAEKYAAALEDDIRSGRYKDEVDRTLTFAEAAEKYLASKHSLAQGSISRYERELRMYVFPQWGNVPISAITEEDINSWITRLAEGIAPYDFRTKSKPKCLAPATIRNIVAITFGGVLRYAASSKRRWIKSNPLEGIELPRMYGAKSGIFLQDIEVEALADAAFNLPRVARRKEIECDLSSATLIRFMAYSGPRPNEALAIQIQDLDLEKCRASINKTWAGGDRSSKELGHTKTWEIREIAFPRFLVNDLRTLIAGRKADDYVFTTARGKSIWLSNWRNRVFKGAREGAGLEVAGLSPNSLRHTYASLAIQSGADVKTVQNQLGHKDATITLNTYAGLWPDRLNEVAEILSDRRTKALQDSE